MAVGLGDKELILLVVAVQGVVVVQGDKRLLSVGDCRARSCGRTGR